MFLGCPSVRPKPEIPSFDLYMGPLVHPTNRDRFTACLSVRPSVRPSVCRRHGFRSISQVCFGISISNFICILMVAIGRSLLIFSDVTFRMTAWRPYWIFGFQTLNLLWLWISTSNFSGTILMYMGRSLLIFSNVIFKMTAWWPYWIFRFLDSEGGMVSGV